MALLLVIVVVQRSLPAAYGGDGISDLRKAVSGRDLPNARLVSLGTRQTANASDATRSSILFAFGQFVAHASASFSAKARQRDKQRDLFKDLTLVPFQNIVCCDMECE